MEQYPHLSCWPGEFGLCGSHTCNMHIVICADHRIVIFCYEQILHVCSELWSRLLWYNFAKVPYSDVGWSQYCNFLLWTNLMFRIVDQFVVVELCKTAKMLLIRTICYTVWSTCTWNSCNLDNGSHMYSASSIGRHVSGFSILFVVEG